MSIPIKALVSETIGGGWGVEEAGPEDTAVRIIRGADFPEVQLRRTTSAPVRFETQSRAAPRILRVGDIVLEISGGTRDRPTGRTVLITQKLIDQSPEPLIPASFCRLVRIDESKADPRFVYYALQSFYASGRTWEMQNQSTGLSNFQYQIFREKCLLPNLSIPQQTGIADVLSSIDNKIAVNTELIALLWAHLDALLELALTRGYTTVHLAEAVDFHNRKRIPLSVQERERRPGQVPYYGATGVFGHVDSAIFHEPLVLVGEDGSVITDEGRPVVQYIWGPSWVNNHAHVLTGASTSTELLALALRRADVRHLVTGAVQPKISMGKLRTLTLDLPQGKPLRELEDMCAREMALLRATVEESRTLVTLRDALLPQLMSGNLRVKDAEKQVEEVG